MGDHYKTPRVSIVSLKRERFRYSNSDCSCTDSCVEIATSIWHLRLSEDIHFQNQSTDSSLFGLSSVPGGENCARSLKPHSKIESYLYFGIDGGQERNQRIERTTVVAILNREGSVSNFHLHRVYYEIQGVLCSTNATMEVRYLPGIQNVLAHT